MKQRKASVSRKSSETDITVKLNIDGSGKSKIKTPIGLLNHMLELFAFHGFFDLDILVKKADLAVDIHHANEDLGIVLGKAFKAALGDMQGIRRFGRAAAPMEETLATVVVDLSGRGMFQFHKEADLPLGSEQEGYSLTHLEHFLESLAKTLGANIHLELKKASGDLHTNLETVFKALGLALDEATRIDPRRKGIPSTKGIIDA